MSIIQDIKKIINFVYQQKFNSKQMLSYVSVKIYSKFSNNLKYVNEISFGCSI